MNAVKCLRSDPEHGFANGGHSHSQLYRLHFGKTQGVILCLLIPLTTASFNRKSVHHLWYYAYSYVKESAFF